MLVDVLLGCRGASSFDGLQALLSCSSVIAVGDFVAQISLQVIDGLPIVCSEWQSWLLVVRRTGRWR
jgi:hypothetical protein